MQLSSHVDRVATHLTAAAALGDDRTREIAEKLATTVVPAVQLALYGALSEAADEITSVLVELPGSPAVAVRLEQQDAVFDVRLADGPDPVPPPERGREDGDSSARISLRLSEGLKGDIDAAAARDGLSVNAWLVRAAEAALNPNPFDALAAFGKTFAGGVPGARSGRKRRQGGYSGGTYSGGPDADSWGWRTSYGPDTPRDPDEPGGEHVTGWING